METKTKLITISFFDLLRTKSAGAENRVIKKRLSEYVPITDTKLIKLSFSEKLKIIKFQGKPVKIWPRINSTRPNNSEKRKNALNVFFILNKLKIIVTRP